MMQYSAEVDELWREFKRNFNPSNCPSDPLLRVEHLKYVASTLARQRNEAFKLGLAKRRPHVVRLIDRRITAVTRALRRWKRKAHGYATQCKASRPLESIKRKRRLIYCLRCQQPCAERDKLIATLELQIADLHKTIGICYAS